MSFCSFYNKMCQGDNGRQQWPAWAGLGRQAALLAGDSARLGPTRHPRKSFAEVCTVRGALTDFSPDLGSNDIAT